MPGRPAREEKKGEKGRKSSASRKGSLDPSLFIDECDNIKQESDRKVVHPFFVTGIGQYFKDKLEHRVSLTSKTSKIVYVKETVPELVVSDGAMLMKAKLDSSIKRDCEVDLKGTYCKINDYSFTLKMDSLIAENSDLTKIFFTIKKFQLINNDALKCAKNVNLQKEVYENEVVKNYIRYTRHKLCRTAAQEIDPKELMMPSMVDINPRDSNNFTPIKTIIKVQNQARNKELTQIIGFTAPTQSDLDSILGKLPPLSYAAVQEVEVEQEPDEEEKELLNKLKEVPDGLALADVLVNLYNDNLDDVEPINNTSASIKNDEDDCDIDPDELESVLATQRKSTPGKLESKRSNQDVDGYSQDELEDCVESDDDFQPKEKSPTPKMLSKEEVESRANILDNVSNRNALHLREKRQKLKEKFTKNITKKDWEEFKKWNAASQV